VRTTIGRCGRRRTAEQEREALDEVRRDDVHQVATLLVCFADEAHVAHLEIAEAAVDQLRRAGRCRGGEVAAVDERDVEPMRRRRFRDPCADDAAADDEQVESPRGELLDRCYAVHSGFVQAFVPSAAFTSTRPYAPLSHGRCSATCVISPSSLRSTTRLRLG